MEIFQILSNIPNVQFLSASSSSSNEYIRPFSNTDTEKCYEEVFENTVISSFLNVNLLSKVLKRENKLLLNQDTLFDINYKILILQKLNVLHDLSLSTYTKPQSNNKSTALTSSTYKYEELPIVIKFAIHSLFELINSTPDRKQYELKVKLCIILEGMLKGLDLLSLIKEDCSLLLKLFELCSTTFVRLINDNKTLEIDRESTNNIKEVIASLIGLSLCSGSMEILVKSLGVILQSICTSSYNNTIIDLNPYFSLIQKHLCNVNIGLMANQFVKSIEHQFIDVFHGPFIRKVPSTSLSMVFRYHDALTTDCTYIYAHNEYGLFKFGTGYNSTVAGKVYAHRLGYHLLERSWLAFLKGKLYFRSRLMIDKLAVELDPYDFHEIRSIIVKNSRPVNMMDMFADENSLFFLHSPLTKCLKQISSQGICTFSITGTYYVHQHWYHCRTCGGDNAHVGACPACAKICHYGHQVELSDNSPSKFFCDCGSLDLGLSHCKCVIKDLAKAENLPESDSFKEPMPAPLAISDVFKFNSPNSPSLSSRRLGKFNMPLHTLIPESNNISSDTPKKKPRNMSVFKYEPDEKGDFHYTQGAPIGPDIISELSNLTLPESFSPDSFEPNLINSLHPEIYLTACDGNIIAVAYSTIQDEKQVHDPAFRNFHIKSAIFSPWNPEKKPLIRELSSPFFYPGPIAFDHIHNMLYVLWSSRCKISFFNFHLPDCLHSKPNSSLEQPTPILSSVAHLCNLVYQLSEASFHSDETTNPFPIVERNVNAELDAFEQFFQCTVQLLKNSSSWQEDCISYFHSIVDSILSLLKIRLNSSNLYSLHNRQKILEFLCFFANNKQTSVNSKISISSLELLSQNISNFLPVNSPCFSLFLDSADLHESLFSQIKNINIFDITPHESHYNILVYLISSTREELFRKCNICLKKEQFSFSFTSSRMHLLLNCLKYLLRLNFLNESNENDFSCIHLILNEVHTIINLTKEKYSYPFPAECEAILFDLYKHSIVGAALYPLILSFIDLDLFSNEALHYSLTRVIADFEVLVMYFPNSCHSCSSSPSNHVETIMQSQIIESSHPFFPKQIVQSVNFNDAQALKVTFDPQSHIPDNSGYLVLDIDEFPYLPGPYFPKKPFLVKGSTLNVYFRALSSYSRKEKSFMLPGASYYGFKIEITPIIFTPTPQLCWLHDVLSTASFLFGRIVSNFIHMKDDKYETLDIAQFESPLFSAGLATEISPNNEFINQIASGGYNRFLEEAKKILKERPHASSTAMSNALKSIEARLFSLIIQFSPKNIVHSLYDSIQISTTSALTKKHIEILRPYFRLMFNIERFVLERGQLHKRYCFLHQTRPSTATGVIDSLGKENLILLATRFSVLQKNERFSAENDLIDLATTFLNFMCKDMKYCNIDGYKFVCDQILDRMDILRLFQRPNTLEDCTNYLFPYLCTDDPSTLSSTSFQQFLEYQRKKCDKRIEGWDFLQTTLSTLNSPFAKRLLFSHPFRLPHFFTGFPSCSVHLYPDLRHSFSRLLHSLLAIIENQNVDSYIRLIALNMCSIAFKLEDLEIIRSSRFIEVLSILENSLCDLPRDDDNNDSEREIRAFGWICSISILNSLIISLCTWISQYREHSQQLMVLFHSFISVANMRLNQEAKKFETRFNLNKPTNSEKKRKSRRLSAKKFVDKGKSQHEENYTDFETDDEVCYKWLLMLHPITQTCQVISALSSSFELVKTLLLLSNMATLRIRRLSLRLLTRILSSSNESEINNNLNVNIGKIIDQSFENCASLFLSTNRLLIKKPSIINTSEQISKSQQYSLSIYLPENMSPNVFIDEMYTHAFHISKLKHLLPSNMKLNTWLASLRRSLLTKSAILINDTLERCHEFAAILGQHTLSTSISPIGYQFLLKNCFQDAVSPRYEIDGRNTLCLLSEFVSFLRSLIYNNEYNSTIMARLFTFIRNIDSSLHYFKQNKANTDALKPFIALLVLGAHHELFRTGAKISFDANSTVHTGTLINFERGLAESTVLVDNTEDVNLIDIETELLRTFELFSVNWNEKPLSSYRTKEFLHFLISSLDKSLEISNENVTFGIALYSLFRRNILVLLEKILIDENGILLVHLIEDSDVALFESILQRIVTRTSKESLHSLENLYHDSQKLLAIAIDQSKPDLYDMCESENWKESCNELSYQPKLTEKSFPIQLDYFSSSNILFSGNNLRVEFFSSAGLVAITEEPEVRASVVTSDHNIPIGPIDEKKSVITQYYFEAQFTRLQTGDCAMIGFRSKTRDYFVSNVGKKYSSIRKPFDRSNLAPDDIVDVKDPRLRPPRWEPALVLEIRSSRIILELINFPFADMHLSLDKQSESIQPFLSRTSGCIGVTNDEPLDYYSQFNEGDVVGCCVNFVNGSITYSVNGNVLQPAFTEVPLLDMKPSIALLSSNTEISVNFGQEKFVCTKLPTKLESLSELYEKRLADYHSAITQADVLQAQAAAHAARAKEQKLSHRQQLARSIISLGFFPSATEKQLMRALELQNDDSQRTVDWIFEQPDSFAALADVEESSPIPSRKKEPQGPQISEIKEQKASSLSSKDVLLIQNGLSYDFQNCINLENSNVEEEREEVRTWLSEVETGLRRARMDRASIERIMGRLRSDPRDMVSLLQVREVIPNLSDAPQPVAIEADHLPSKFHYVNHVPIIADLEVGMIVTIVKNNSSTEIFSPNTLITIGMQGIIKKLEKNLALVRISDSELSQIQEYWYPFESLRLAPSEYRDYRVGINDSSKVLDLVYRDNNIIYYLARKFIFNLWHLHHIPDVLQYLHLFTLEKLDFGFSNITPSVKFPSKCKDLLCSSTFFSNLFQEISSEIENDSKVLTVCSGNPAVNLKINNSRGIILSVMNDPKRKIGHYSVVIYDTPTCIHPFNSILVNNCTPVILPFDEVWISLVPSSLKKNESLVSNISVTLIANPITWKFALSRVIINLQYFSDYETIFFIQLQTLTQTYIPAPQRIVLLQSCAVLLLKNPSFATPDYFKQAKIADFLQILSQELSNRFKDLNLKPSKNQLPAIRNLALSSLMQNLFEFLSIIWGKIGYEISLNDRENASIKFFGLEKGNKHSWFSNCAFAASLLRHIALVNELPERFLFACSDGVDSLTNALALDFSYHPSNNTKYSTKDIAWTSIRFDALLVSQMHLASMHMGIPLDEIAFDDIKFDSSADLLLFSSDLINAHYVALNKFNDLITLLLPFIDFSNSSLSSLAVSFKKLRNLIFFNKKMNFVQSILDYTSSNSEDIRRFPITIDKDISSQQGHTIFEQAAHQLMNINPVLLRTPTKPQPKAIVPFEVRLKDEKVVGTDGPYRHFFASITNELMEPYNNLLNLFVPCPNAKDKSLLNREKFVISPLGDLSLFRFFGKLLAIAVRSSILLPLNLSSLFWKNFNDEIVIRDDLLAIDTILYTSTIFPLIECKSNHEFERNFSDGLFFTCYNSLQELVELIPNGKNISVNFDNRLEFVSLVENYRFNEGKAQMKALQEGLFSIIPRNLIHLLSNAEWELIICGRKTIDLALLRRHTEYSSEIENDTELIENFWSVLNEFTEEEKCKFLEFSYAQSRLPSEEDFSRQRIRLLISSLDCDSPDSTFPVSDTCFFNLKLPPYSDINTMRRGLKTAIYCCNCFGTLAEERQVDALSRSIPDNSHMF